MVELTEFDLKREEVVVETKQGKVRLTFEEWKQVADGYHAWVEVEHCHPPDDCEKCAYAPQGSELCIANLVVWSSEPTENP